MIFHLIFPNMPICIQTYALWYFFVPQIYDAGEVDRQTDGETAMESVYDKNLALLH